MLLDDKILMITGGTGSFGNTVLQRFLSSSLREIVIFSRDEKKQEDMRIAIQNPRVRFVLGDVRDPGSLMRAMKGVDYVFHAAALKQVPSCEFFPMEAVRTNIVGTENVITAAVESGVERMILLSTDKAVYPINAMGISKSMAEKILLARARQLGHEASPVLCATRYGNVMASRGSVIPLFVDKIKAGQPLTITNPKMTRFLMSLEESVDLVLHAFEHGEQGDLFVQKAPACSVEVLALALKELFNSDVPIDIIGARHGEKLHETLVSAEELAKAEDLDRYYRIPADHRDLNYASYTVEGNVTANSVDDYTSSNTTQLSKDEVVETLQSLSYIRDELNKGRN
jgi:UDP-N-acetylglucosamine 4,6-dehydratase/5-epimerase